MNRKRLHVATLLFLLILFVIFGAELIASVPTFFSSSPPLSESLPETEDYPETDPLPVTAFSPESQPPPGAENSSASGAEIHSAAPAELDIGSLLESMNDTELLGQIFLLGYYGSTPSSDILHWIGEKKIGGVKIFGWNAEDIEKLSHSISTMQRRAAETRLSIPLFVATDQEGGWVRHVKSETSITPGNMAIGATGLPYDAYWSGYYIGRELKTVGININFAPTVDIYSNTKAHVIGPRSFSQNPLETARLAVAYYSGMDASGIVSTAKHFPGHGNAAEDSHGTLPVIETTFSVMWERELLPYRLLIREELPAVMSGHLSFPQIIDEGLPASLSPYFLREVLRDKLGFSGITITDDMRMHAVIGKDYNTPEACLRAFKAGNDMIMLSRDTEMYRRVWDLFYRELRTDESFRSILRDSVRRILRIKRDYLLQENAAPLFPDSASVKEKVPSERADNFFFDQACRSVSIIREGRIPIESVEKPEDSGNILIVGQLRTFLRTGKRYYPRADTMHFPYTPFYDAASSTVAAVRRRAAEYDIVIFLLANPNSGEVLDGLSQLEGEVVVLSTLTPVYLTEREWVETAVAVYGTGEDSALAGFATLSGMIRPEGRVPFRLYDQPAPAVPASHEVPSGASDPAGTEAKETEGSEAERNGSTGTS